MPFNIADHPLALELPLQANSISAWLSHIPLAPVIVELLRPEVFVELGTHAGDSYFAFCQAVRSLKLSTRCSAIDTWKGDPQASFYGPEIFEHVKRMNDAHFTAFSQLIQSTFVAALPRFAEASIDLLHIDGLHDYDSVKHDFESWLPKLSPRAVVLFHDTAERTPTFGVWKVWEELRVRYRNAHIPHGHGLGILAVGPNVPAAFLDFLNELNTRPALVQAFDNLGLHIHLLSRYQFAISVVKDCQDVVNQWRTRTGQPIVNPAPNMQHVADTLFQFGTTTRQEVHKLLGDALNVAAEVTRLRAGPK